MGKGRTVSPTARGTSGNRAARKVILVPALLMLLSLACFAAPAGASERTLLARGMALLQDAEAAAGQAQLDLLTEARDAFREVVTAYPDSPGARQLQGPGVPILGGATISLDALEQRVATALLYRAGPDDEIRAGQSRDGLALRPDGSAEFHGRPLFPAHGDVSSLNVYHAPDGRRAFAVQWSADRGGVRAGIVDLEREVVISNTVISEEQVAGLAPAEDARVVLAGAVWAPDSSVVAFPFSESEWQADLGLLLTADGRFGLFRPDDLGAENWAFPDLAAVSLKDLPSVFSIFEVLSCADEACEQPIQLGTSTGSFSMETVFGAVDVFGPQSVFPRGLNGYRLCRDTADLSGWLKCMEDEGLPGQALELSVRQQRTLVVEDFVELGRVDLMRAQSPTANDPNPEVFLVNGAETIFDWRRVPEVHSEEVYRDAESRAVLRRYPQPYQHAPQPIGHRSLPDGNQRFVFGQLMTDRCGQCDIIGSSRFALIFDLAGRYLRFEPIGLSIDEFRAKAEPTPDWLAANPQAMQDILINRGYDPGPADGAPGPRTRRALAEFQAEHCLAPTGVLDRATAAALLDTSLGDGGACGAPHTSAGVALDATPRPDRDSLSIRLPTDEGPKLPADHAGVEADPTGDALLALGPQAIRDIQARLLVLGHDPNGIDGVIGDGTRQALREWQRSRGAVPDGALTPDQIEDLKTRSQSALAAWLEVPENARLHRPPRQVPPGESIRTGTWSGTVRQAGVAMTYSVRVAARNDRITVDYPELRCSGTWSRVSRSDARAVYRERISSGKTRCVDGGFAVLSREKDGSLRFEWRRTRGSDPEAWARLQRE